MIAQVSGSGVHASHGGGARASHGGGTQASNGSGVWQKPKKREPWRNVIDDEEVQRHEESDNQADEAPVEVLVKSKAKNQFKRDGSDFQNEAEPENYVVGSGGRNEGLSSKNASPDVETFQPTEPMMESQQ